MTPKEKAEELINKMLEDFVYFANKEIAKRHALIAVEEILGYMGADRGTEFWLEVRSELKKL